MLTEVLHRIAAQPAVYDTIQVLAGSAEVNRRVARLMSELPKPSIILDLGGGTGLAPQLMPKGATYLCLDLDPMKLEGYRRKNPNGIALAGDATRLPLTGRAFDVVVCKAVSHHLTDAQVPLLFNESARVLRPGGHLLFLDALLDPRRWRSRQLWRYDRGSFPRSEAALRDAISRDFEITHWEVFAIHHRYVLAVGRTRTNAG